MKHILIIGAGLSATSLIRYLLKHSEENNWKVTVGDIILKTAQRKIENHQNGRAIQFDVNDLQQRAKEIYAADIVVSMLPVSMHSIVAKECLKYGKHMLTPSYVSPEMLNLDEEVRAKGLIFLNELGVDPGIDHMSAMRIIHEIKAKKGKLLGFKSCCGGLVAPECDNNPWKYKFSWNPRNIVLAGQGIATYKEKDHYKYIPYNKLFTTLSKVQIPGYGEFEIYPNRDALIYCDRYGIEDIPSIFRGTMRRPGYSEAWNLFVQLGCTDDTYVMKDSHLLTHKQYIESFLPNNNTEKSIKERMANFTQTPLNSPIMQKMHWLGIFSDKTIGIKNATPAMILQKILEEKWVLEPQDRDLLVMYHQFDYELDGHKKRLISSFCLEGKDRENTAIAYTVGIPLAIATKLLANGKIHLPGVYIPTIPDIYNPILNEMEELGIRFVEEEKEIE